MKEIDPKQRKTPFLTALKKFMNEGVSPFDVPGHHLGNVPNKFKDLVGKKVFEADCNAPYGLDALAKPHGVIKEAEELLAEACHADNCFFLIDGTSSGIIAYILASVRANEKIILPRNIHKSVTSALILSGAVPVYVMPKLDNQLEIANQPTVEDYKRAILKNPSAKVVFVINPTYFGSITNLEEIVNFAHEKGMSVLVDEAHGAHYYFTDKGPLSAMRAGADAAAISFHKCGGSLTQSSILLTKGNKVRPEAVQNALNMINTTSPSSILIASIDAARYYMVTKGEEAMVRVHDLSKYASKVIKKIPGFVLRDAAYFKRNGSYDYDMTKLVIETDKLDLNGFEVYRLLKTKYHVQMELAEQYVFLGLVTIGTKKKFIDNLASALRSISKDHYKKNMEYPVRKFSSAFPYMVARPRVVFHAPGQVCEIKDSLYRIAREPIMIYPPGIPIIMPGEVVTKEVINCLTDNIDKGATVFSTYGNGYIDTVDLDNWKKYGKFKMRLKDYIETRKTTPRFDDYYMPFEGEKHDGTLILLPFRADVWRLKGVPARETLKTIITRISKYEKVYIGIHPTIYDRVVDEFSSIPNTEIIKIEYNDAWARDISALPLTNGNNVRCVDFRFNAWGGSYDGIYSNYKDDDAFGKRIAKKLNIDCYSISNFILEGGSIHVDGEGTCICTEACLLSPGRNPDFIKVEIEEELQINLNVNKVVWIPHGIYLDETNEHVDNIACFVRPGEIALGWTDDKDSIQYKYCLEDYKALKNTTDAKGRKFVIHKIDLPPEQYMTEEEASQIQKGTQNAKPREAKSLLSASYINYYQGEKFIVLPAFGIPEDKKAFKTFSKLYPDKEIIQVNTRELLLGGGNIHCMTMQIPAGKKEDHYED